MAVYTIEWAGKLGGDRSGPGVIHLPEAGTPGSYKKGDPVIFDLSDDGVKLASVGTVNATGIAARNQVGTAQQLVPVIIPTPQDLFVATISASGANSAAAHNQDNLADAYGWIRSTESGQTAKQTVDFDNTSNAWILPLKLYEADPEGTAGGRVVFRFIMTAFEAAAVA